MLWTEFQAYCTAVSQIGTSACGATAVFNVLVGGGPSVIFSFNIETNVTGVKANGYLQCLRDYRFLKL